MEKRLIIAIALSGLVLLIFSRFRTPPPEPVGRPEFAETQATYEEPSAKGTPTYDTTSEVLEPVSAKETETTIETDKAILTFTNIGGGLKSAALKKYDTVLFDELNPPASMFSMTAPIIERGLRSREFDVQRTGNKLIYTYTNQAKNITVRKEFTIHNANDYIELQIFIENISPANPIEVNYNILGPSKIKNISSLKGRTFVEANAQVDGKIVRKNRISGNHETLKGIISWVAVKNRYFAVALKPPRECEGIFLQADGKKISTGILNGSRIVRPNSYITDSYVLYLGPLIKKRLAIFDIGLEGIVNYGFFGGISTFLLSLLGRINSVVHNWGVSIILVTFLINIIMFPLTRKSFMSMQKMQELQPHMEKLKQLHKDNPQKMNKELMQLYKQYNVNPFGGCLPMLLQLPIFFAFYQALMRAIELKNASFLWIKDLSGPDALFSFPQAIPLLGDKFNLLPLITMLVMVVQQRFTTMHTAKQGSSEMAKQQKFMALFFPLFFGFILYGFPSGLVLYWLTNSLLMTSEQFILRRQMNLAKGV